MTMSADCGVNRRCPTRWRRGEDQSTRRGIKELHDSLQRNLHMYLTLAMDAIAGVYQKAKASNTPDASRQMVWARFFLPFLHESD
jgi:hypothetical protein